MQHVESVAHKLKIIRVVTAQYVVPWHLANTLKRMPADFEVYVVGNGVSIHQDSYPGVHWVDIGIERKFSLLPDLSAILALCRLFRTIRPDIVHSIMPKSGLLAALAGAICHVPVRMHTFTGQVWVTRQGLARWIYRAVDRLIVLLNTLCLTDSFSQSEYIFKQGIRKFGRPLPVLAQGSLSGVDTERFHIDQEVRSRVRKEFGIPANATVFLYLGRLNRDKGILDLAAAFATLQDTNAHLIIAGPDEEDVLPQALSVLDACRDRVHVSGFVKQPEYMFMAADVFCLPSRREGFGSVVIEAAACGLPAIGTHIPGLVDAIEDGVTGMLVPVGAPQSLAACMKVMLTAPERRIEMGGRARSRAEQQFGAEVLYQALRSQYQDLAMDNGAFSETGAQ